MAPFCDMMPNLKNPCLNQIIKWHKEISQQLSQESLRVLKYIKKKPHNPHFLQKVQVTLGISSLHGAHTQLNLSGCFHNEGRFWSGADDPYWMGGRQKLLQKVSWSTSRYLNYNLHCFGEITARLLFKGRSRLTCTLEALMRARSLLKLLSENVQGHLLKSSHTASILKQPLLHSDPLTTTWAATASAVTCPTLITHAERGTAWLVPSTACLGMGLQLNTSLFSVLFQ